MKWNVEEYKEFLDLGDKIYLQRKNVSPKEHKRFKNLEDFYEGLNNRANVFEAHDALVAENEHLRSIINRMTDYSVNVDDMINVEKYKKQVERLRAVAGEA